MAAFGFQAGAGVIVVVSQDVSSDGVYRCREEKWMNLKNADTGEQEMA